MRQEKNLVRKYFWIILIIIGFCISAVFAYNSTINDTRQPPPTKSTPETQSKVEPNKENNKKNEYADQAEEIHEHKLFVTDNSRWHVLLARKSKLEGFELVGMESAPDGSVYVLSKLWKKPRLLTFKDSDGYRIIKLSSSGNILWEHDVLDEKNELTPISLVNAGDDGIYVLCSSVLRSNTNDVKWRGQLNRISASGKKLWSKRVGGDDNRLRFLKKSPLGGVFVTGWAWFENTGSSGGWIGHYSSEGILIWEHIHKNKTETETEAEPQFISYADVVARKDGTVAVLFHVNELGNAGLYWGESSLELLNKKGDIISQHNLNTDAISKGYANIPQSIVITPNNQLVILLVERDFNSKETTPYRDRVRIVMFDQSSRLKWSKTNTEDNYPNQKIIALPNGTIIGVGTTISKNQQKVKNKKPEENFMGVIAKLNIDGDSLWAQTVDGTRSDGFYDITLSEDGGVYILGYSLSFKYRYPIWLIKTDQSFDLPVIDWQNPTLYDDIGSP